MPHEPTPSEDVMSVIPSRKPEVVDDDLVESVIHVESRNNNDATSPVGALGAAQIMPDTARDPGFGVDPVANPRDPVQARTFVRQYLTAMIKRYHGDLPMALRAYNWGPGNADNYIANGRTGFVPKETQDYVNRVQEQLGVRNPKPGTGM